MQRRKEERRKGRQAMKLSVFREAPLPDGTPGPVSFRRVSSAVLLVAALALFGAALDVVQRITLTAAWVVFIPGALCLGVGALMPILTTISDVQAIIHAVVGKTPPAGMPAKEGP
jgi:hypothetical protein